MPSGSLMQESQVASIAAIPSPTLNLSSADITTLLLDATAFGHVIDILAERYKDMNVDVIAGAHPDFSVLF